MKGFFPLFLYISLALFLWVIENNKPNLVERFKGQARASFEVKINSNLFWSENGQWTLLVFELFILFSLRNLHKSIEQKCLRNFLSLINLCNADRIDCLAMHGVELLNALQCYCYWR